MSFFSPELRAVRLPVTGNKCWVGALTVAVLGRVRCSLRILSALFTHTNSLQKATSVVETYACGNPVPTGSTAPPSLFFYTSLVCKHRFGSLQAALKTLTNPGRK